MRPSARSTEELGSGFTSVRSCAPEAWACTLLRSRIGLQLARRGLGLRALLVALGRRDDHLHAPGARGRARAARRAAHFRDSLLHVVGDDVACELVVVAL